jgi:integrase/recombinase XerD
MKKPSVTLELPAYTADLAAQITQVETSATTTYLRELKENAGRLSRLATSSGIDDLLKSANRTADLVRGAQRSALEEATGMRNSIAKQLGYGGVLAEMRKLDAGRSMLEEYGRSDFARMTEMAERCLGDHGEIVRAAQKVSAYDELVRQVEARWLTDWTSEVSALLAQTSAFELARGDFVRDALRSIGATDVPAYAREFEHIGRELLQQLVPSADAHHTYAELVDQLQFDQLIRYAEELADQEIGTETSTSSAQLKPGTATMHSTSTWTPAKFAAFLRWFLLILMTISQHGGGGISAYDAYENIRDRDAEHEREKITPLADGCRVKARGGLRLRRDPSRNADVLNTIPDGALVTCMGFRGDWMDVVVDADGHRLRGWAHGSHVEIVEGLPSIDTAAQLASIGLDAQLPTVIVEAGDRAQHAYVEFFTARIPNRNTRIAYARACNAFLAELERGEIALTDVRSHHVAIYIAHLSQRMSAPSVKQHLAAIRQLFDWMVVSQVVKANPAAAVRGPKHSSPEGKTPILSDEEMRVLFAQFDETKLADLRDRAMLSVMVYSFARASALTKLRVRDYYRQGSSAWFVLSEKGGKQNKVPAHHQAAEAVERYIAVAGIANERDAPLFRSIVGRGTKLSERALSRENVFAMVRRRATAVGLPPEIGCHSFRGTGITNYLSHGGTLETAARIAGHVSTKTTQLYDRRDQAIKQAEIERIRF